MRSQQICLPHSMQSSVPRVPADISTFPDSVRPQPMQHFCLLGYEDTLLQQIRYFQFKQTNKQANKQGNKRLLRLKGSKEMPDSPYTVQSWPICSTEPSLEKRRYKPLSTIILAARDHLLLKDCFIR